VDTPALLPDGTAAEASVSRVLAARHGPLGAGDGRRHRGRSATAGDREPSAHPGAPADDQRRNEEVESTQYVVLSSILLPSQRC
jgi:hypothetical protein